MHPDDVRSRDIAWIKGPEPRLPELRQNGGITSFIGFDGQLHRTSQHLRNSAEYLWALDSDNSFGYAAMARLELLLSWPEPGESLDRWIKVLEEALDRALGIGNPPADSKPPRGESEETKRTAELLLQRLRQRRADHPQGHRGSPATIHACKACREAPAQPGERFCVLCEKELMEDAKRQTIESDCAKQRYLNHQREREKGSAGQGMTIPYNSPRKQLTMISSIRSRRLRSWS